MFTFCNPLTGEVDQQIELGGHVKRFVTKRRRGKHGQMSFPCPDVPNKCSSENEQCRIHE